MQLKRNNLFGISNHGLLKSATTSLRHIPLRRLKIGLPVLVLLFLLAHQTHGNGWEHTAIPFEALVKTLDFGAP